jgi:hypothetical protein
LTVRRLPGRDRRQRWLPELDQVGVGGDGQAALVRSGSANCLIIVGSRSALAAA